MKAGPEERRHLPPQRVGRNRIRWLGSAVLLVALCLAPRASALERDDTLILGGVLLGLGYVSQLPIAFLDRDSLSSDLARQPVWTFFVPVVGSSASLYYAFGSSCEGEKFSGECNFAKGGRIVAFSLGLGLQLAGLGFLAAGGLDALTQTGE
ncbi:MAG: hypothetical protein ABIJ09_27520 [Pseudomonadota bacterium]